MLGHVVIMTLFVVTYEGYMLICSAVSWSSNELCLIILVLTLNVVSHIAHICDLLLAMSLNGLIVNL